MLRPWPAADTLRKELRLMIQVWKLQLDLAKRVGIIIIFCLGGLCAATFWYTIEAKLSYNSTFVAGLSNTVVQIVYLTQPNFAEDAVGGSFFQGS